MLLSHCPAKVRTALGCASHAVIDLETTGIERYDQVVSVGLLVDDAVYILFVRSLHREIRNIGEDQFRWALEPLAREQLTVASQNPCRNSCHLFC
jgi:hypothetical protein